MEIQIAKTKYFRVQVEDGVCVCMWLIPLSTWLWNDKNVCVWANSMILPVLKVACMCVRACIPLALVHHATPSRSELCLRTTLCGLYSFLWVCGCVFLGLFFPIGHLPVMHASRHLSRMG